MSEITEQENQSMPSNEFLIAEVAKIKAGLDELKNLTAQAFQSVTKRKPARKTVKKKTAAKRKPARTTRTRRTKTKTSKRRR